MPDTIMHDPGGRPDSPIEDEDENCEHEFEDGACLHCDEACECREVEPDICCRCGEVII